MSSGSYTNRIRTTSEARVRKVQYRFSNASNYNPLLSTCGANPNFEILDYLTNPVCKPACPPPQGPIYDGGNAIANIYDSGFSNDIYPNILQDTQNPSAPRYDGGNSFTRDIPLLYGGVAVSNFIVIFDGGNSMV